MQDMNALLETALSETKNLKEGESFLVRDLFKGYLWNRIPRGERLLLGSMFLSYVSTHDSQITVIHKGASGAAEVTIRQWSRERPLPNPSQDRIISLCPNPSSESTFPSWQAS